MDGRTLKNCNFFNKINNGWGEKKFSHSLRSAETFSEVEIVYVTRTQLAIAREHYQKEKEDGDGEV